MNVVLLLLIAVPFIGGLLVIFPGRFLRMLRWIFSLLTVLGTALLLTINFVGGTKPGFSLWHVMGSANLQQFSVSPITLVIGAAFVLLWLIVILYSFGYFPKGGEADTEYYSLTLFMLGSTLGLLFANDLIFLYLFWEIAAITTWRLVGFERTQKVISIATKTIIITFFGSALMLVGFAILITNFGSFNLGDMISSQMPVLAGVFILAGIFAKSAVIPLYIWLPDAHPAAPSPMSALLSGVIVKIGLIVYLKMFVQTFSVTPGWNIAILVMVIVSSLVAGGIALIEKDCKRILAYSTISQVAFIFGGLVVVTQIAGSVGGVLYLVAHCLAKGALFLGYGVVVKETGKRNIKEVGRLVARFPLLFVGVMIATLSIIGLPPFLGFFAKIDVIFGVLGLVDVVPQPTYRILLGFGFILSSVLTLLYMLRLFSSVFLTGEKPQEGLKEPIYLSVLVLLLSLSLIGGSVALKPLVAYLAGGG
ncbi:hypothetical protein KAX06_03090 [candidate division WOR-3 bacterium]|nr:hypothetical protein [candidate division WOR-3 bacterium]